LSNSRDDKTLTGSETKASGPQALDALAAELCRHYGSCINSILFYGSCLRNKNPFDGIVDLFLIVDNYADFYHNRIRAFGNWFLPPNVFYKEFDFGSNKLRVKYNVLSITDLRRGVSGQWLHSYLWGRFSQPVDILWVRDEGVRKSVEAYLHQAAKTFLERVLPRASNSGPVSELWEQGLRLSYSAELRSEGHGRARELIESGLQHYISVSNAVAPSLRYPLQITGDGRSAWYTATVPDFSRFTGRWAWALRRITGKVLSVARLVKALFTFEGGLDYVAWKLERHSGQTVEIPDRVRQHPLIFVWPLLWRLYRRGVIH